MIPPNWVNGITRRRLLRGFGASGLASLAGCTSGSGDEGIHWHVELTIEIQGEEQVIPADVGIGPEHADNPYYDNGMQMTSIHTHDESGTIHWEVTGTPTDGELRLGAFFDIWGKTFNETCIFDYCNDESGEVLMMVNGEPNDEFEDYVVSDGDDIVIRYE